MEDEVAIKRWEEIRETVDMRKSDHVENAKKNQVKSGLERHPEPLGCANKSRLLLCGKASAVCFLCQGFFFCVAKSKSPAYRCGSMLGSA